MNISFYTASVGAREQQTRLDVHGNNIANINTAGFRAKLPSFHQLMTGPVRGIEDDLARGYGSRMEDAQTDFNPSALKGTDRPLDYAISGKGFFMLQDPRTGEISYTRDGSFTKSQFFEADGTEHWYLSDGVGRFVLGADTRRIEVEDEQTSLEQTIGVFDFVNHDGMLSLGDNRLIPVEKNGQVGRGEGTVTQRYLEMSNADLANEMTKVIESQRSFQFMLRMVSASDEIESTINNLR